VLSQWIGLEWDLRQTARSDISIRVQGDLSGKEIRLPDGFFGKARAAWLRADSLPTLPLDWRPVRECESTALPAGTLLPVLYGEPAPALDACEPSLTDVRFSVDLFGGIFFLISRYEELVLESAVDDHGRFPYEASIAHKAAFLNLPLADAYTELLCSAILRLWPRAAVALWEYRVVLTHDVDMPLARWYPGFLALLRSAVGDVVKRKEPVLAVRRAASWARVVPKAYDPWNCFEFLMDVAERHQLTATFNFLARDGGGPLEGQYALEDPWIRVLMRSIHRRGHQLGLHATYGADQEPSLLLAEFQLLLAACQALGVHQRRWGVRHHFLRWTPRAWGAAARAGLDFDTTVGYGQHTGFRAGTARSFSTYDLANRRELGLTEQPLLVMDATLTYYGGLAPEMAMRAAADVAAQCRRFRGSFVLLWHNSALGSRREQSSYRELVEELANPYGRSA
jgi:hypothetical protein